MAVLEILAMAADHLTRVAQQLGPETPRCAVTLRQADQLADRVTPTQLLLEHVEPVIAGVAVGDDKAPEVLAEQLLGRGLAAGRVDPVARHQRRRRDPHPAGLAFQPPRGFIRVHRTGFADRVAQLPPRVSQHRAHPHHARVDRAETDRAAEHLAHDIGDLPPREAIHAREHGDMRLHPGPERRAGHPVRQLSERRVLAPRAHEPVQTMLEDQRDDQRQLPLLISDRIANPLLTAIKPVPAPARHGKMLKALLHSLRCGQLAGPALMTRLPASLTLLSALLLQAPLRPLTRQRATLLTSQRRIVRRRQRTIRRIALEQPLVLIHPLAQHRDLSQQPKHQLACRLPTSQRNPLRIPNVHERKIPCAAQESSQSPRPHLNAYAALAMARRLGLAKLLARSACRERDLCMAMIVERVIAPGSKLGMVRTRGQSTLASELGVQGADEDDLYLAMDWLLERQDTIEDRLATRHLRDGEMVLYDVSSSYFEGRTCRLAKLGYSRDGKPGLGQIIYGLLCDTDGRPVAVEVFTGECHDDKTLPSQIEKLKDRFGLTRVIVVADRGMVTKANIELLNQAAAWTGSRRSKPRRSRNSRDPACFNRPCLTSRTLERSPTSRSFPGSG